MFSVVAGAAAILDFSTNFCAPFLFSLKFVINNNQSTVVVKQWNYFHTTWKFSFNFNKLKTQNNFEGKNSLNETTFKVYSFHYDKIYSSSISSKYKQTADDNKHDRTPL